MNFSSNLNDYPYMYYQQSQQATPAYVNMNSNEQQQSYMPQYNLSPGRVIPIPVTHCPIRTGSTSPPACRSHYVPQHQVPQYQPSQYHQQPLYSTMTQQQQPMPQYQHFQQQPTYTSLPQQRQPAFDDFDAPFGFLDNHQRFDTFFDHQPSDLGTTQSSRVDDFFPSFQRTIPERQRSPYRFQGNTSASNNNNNNDYFPLNSSKPLHGTTSTSTIDSPSTQAKQYTNNNPIAAKEIPVNIIPPTYHQPNNNLTTTPLTELRRFPTRTNQDTSNLSPPKQGAKSGSRQQSPAPATFEYSSSPTTSKLTQQQQDTMGLTQPKYENPNKPAKTAQYQSDFVRLATDAAATSNTSQQPPKSRSNTPVCVVRSPLEKLDEIGSKLDELDKSVNVYTNGTNKKDKQFLVLEEYLTRCLLNLDEIERGDERINDQRKKLINQTQRIIEKLEAKLLPTTDEILTVPHDHDDKLSIDNDEHDKSTTDQSQRPNDVLHVDEDDIKSN